MNRLAARHPGFGKVAAALADWYIGTGALLWLAQGRLLSAGSYSVIADATRILTFGVVGEGTVPAMRAIGALYVVLGVAMRWALHADRTPTMRWFRWAWAAACIAMFTWSLGFVGPVLMGEATAVTGPLTYLTMLRVMVAGMSEPLDRHGMQAGDD